MFYGRIILLATFIGTHTPYHLPTHPPLHPTHPLPPPFLQRVRTVQRFDDGGNGLECFCLIREQRVLDAVTGALDRYPRGGGHR